MSDIKKNIRRVFWLFFIMFFGIIVYLGHFAIFVAGDIINSTLNPRVRITRENINRGYILDRNGIVLANNDNNKRYYPYGRAFSHIVGHVAVGHASVEERYNFQLTALRGEFIQRVNNLAFGTDLVGNSVTLTVDSSLQNFMYNTLGQRRGSIIVLEPSTGNILGMVSYPNYNPNTVGTYWQYLITDETSPLLNRGTQGLYAPGSTFKIITSATAIKSQIYKDFMHDCQGYININGEIIRCFNLVAHGKIDMVRAFALSCNTYFVALANYIGVENFATIADSYFLNVPFSLPISQSQLNLSPQSTVGELMQKSIGQGKVLTTPLYMAMIAGAVLNEGVMVAPNIVKNTSILNFINNQQSWEVFTPQQVTQLKYMMREVVTNGTGQPAALPNVQLAGKTGTAENDTGESHGWFVGIVLEKDIAIAVLLENSGGTGPVLPIVRNVINYIVSNI